VLADLGRALFSDARLSADGKVSCATCHQPDKAFQDGLPTARGAYGQLGTRNTPSLLNVASQRELFWDGRRDSLSAQALDPLTNPREHGLKNVDDLVARIDAIPEYRSGFRAAHAAAGRQAGPAVDASAVAAALAAFETQLVDGESPFERFRFGGDAHAISEPARRGWVLFSGAAKCVSCHEVGERRPASFTDQSYHALTSLKRPGGQALADLVTRFMRERDAGTPIDQLLLSDEGVSELGRFVVTRSPSDIGKFKTPSLRNVALTAPYMHDGSVATLADAVNLEATYRGSQDGHPLILTDDEKADLVAFLLTLTAGALHR
jgi:cytochrome c peroxidase